MMPVLMSSRRTVMSGEVVTFTTAFTPCNSAFGKAWEAAGNFEVSASRDAVVVHHATCKSTEEVDELIEAIRRADLARVMLVPTWRGGAPSMFPEEPTACDATRTEGPE